MNEEILPACERLRREKGQYMEWQAENAKLDALRRFCVAYRYVEAQRWDFPVVFPPMNILLRFAQAPIIPGYFPKC